MRLDELLTWSFMRLDERLTWSFMRLDELLTWSFMRLDELLTLSLPFQRIASSQGMSLEMDDNPERWFLFTS